MKTIVIVPTLNEKKNITLLIKKLIRVSDKFDILIIDDNSTDGSRNDIIAFNKTNKKINFIFRKKKVWGWISS